MKRREGELLVLLGSVLWNLPPRMVPFPWRSPRVDAAQGLLFQHFLQGGILLKGQNKQATFC